MSSFHRILVGWDGSKDSRQAFRTATRLAVELHAEVVVLAVLKRPSRAEAADEAAEDSAHRRSEVVDEMRTEARRRGRGDNRASSSRSDRSRSDRPGLRRLRARARVRSRRRRQTRPRPGGAPAHRRRERASGPPRRLPGDGGGLRLKSPTSLSRRPEAQRVGQHQPRNGDRMAGSAPPAGATPRPCGPHPRSRRCCDEVPKPPCSRSEALPLAAYRNAATAASRTSSATSM